MVGDARAPWPRRALAGSLLVLATLPIYRLLDTPATGSIGEFTLGVARTSAAYTWLASFVLALPALLLAGVLPVAGAAGVLARCTALLRRIPLAAFAAACGLGAFLLALYVNQRVLAGQPNLTDAIAQLVQARYVAAGQLAGPVSEFAPFWNVPLMLFTPAGWVSHFPPGHVLLLGLGFRLGSVALIGPVILGGTVFLTALAADRLFGRDVLAARLAPLLLAGSPFAAAHAAAYMSHTTAALFSVLAVYAALRVWQGGGWFAALLAGASLGALFSTRPLTAVVMAIVLGGAWVWLRRSGGGAPRGRLLAVAALGALPFGLAVAWYNAHFFGSPTRFGYSAALGPSAGLGFGIDPWGNAYGPIAALGYTAAELTALNLFLLETPVPVVVLAGLFLLLARRLEGPVRLVAAWALLPLAAHLFYWHHGMHMGPRMLNEYAPAWCLLVAASAVGLVRLAPAQLAGYQRWSPRLFLAALLLGGWAYALVDGAPRRLSSYRRPATPAVADSLPAGSLVFVHGGWRTRLAMQVAATGIRHDSLEVLMSRNSTCAVQRWFDGERDVALERAWRTDGGRQTSPFDQVEVAPGSGVQVRRGEPWPARCAREAAADRFGVTEVATLVWNAGLPGLEDGSVLFARDLGPLANQRLVSALDRPAYVLQAADSARPAGLLPYARGMAAVWGSRAP